MCSAQSTGNISNSSMHTRNEYPVSTVHCTHYSVNHVILDDFTFFLIHWSPTLLLSVPFLIASYFTTF